MGCPFRNDQSKIIVSKNILCGILFKKNYISIYLFLPAKQIQYSCSCSGQHDEYFIYNLYRVSKTIHQYEIKLSGIVQ
jgi:hypothetical protein